MKKVTYSRRSTHAARAAHARGRREFRTYDTSAIRPKKSKLPYVIAAIVVLAIIVAVIVNISGCSETNDHMVEAGTEVQVDIAEGSTVSSVADALYDAGLIENRNAFKSAVSDQGADSSLQSGVYTFTGGMTNEEIIEQLTSGANGGSTLVVAEGQTLDDIATSVQKAYKGSISADDFKAAAMSADSYVDEYPFVEDAYKGSLEGFLFPKTYDLIANATAVDVVKQMLDQYQIEVASLDYSYPQSQGLSAYETLILASIVEKEATSETMPKVSAVFYNRLTTTGDPSYGTLGSDATTVYEIGDNLDGYDWTTDSPYNTRVTKGLPPTPICSPSLDALEAVCSPEKDFDDYYFFSFWPNDQGEVEYFFDKTYEDHQQTIADHS